MADNVVVEANGGSKGEPQITIVTHAPGCSETLQLLEARIAQLESELFRIKSQRAVSQQETPCADANDGCAPRRRPRSVFLVEIEDLVLVLVWAGSGSGPVSVSMVLLSNQRTKQNLGELGSRPRPLPLTPKAPKSTLRSY